MTMTIGVGGSDAKSELDKLSDMTGDINPINQQEFSQRIDKAAVLMRENQIAAIYLNAGTNLYYFTGTRWGASERMVGAILTAQGQLHYIAPNFEISTLSGYMQVKGQVHGWEEHQNPYQLFSNVLNEIGI